MVYGKQDAKQAFLDMYMYSEHYWNSVYNLLQVHVFVDATIYFSVIKALKY